MTAALFPPCALDVETLDACAALERTIEAAKGAKSTSRTTDALGAAARHAFAAAVCGPDSREAWTAFVRAVAAYLEDLDSCIGCIEDAGAAASRHDLRDILIVNDDLLAYQPSA